MAWPRCETCGERCKHKWRTRGQRPRFCSVACVPRQFRVEAGRKGRQAYIIRRRLALFREELKRLQALERITGEELSASFMAIYSRGWDNGYSTCQTKWLRRERLRKVAA